MNPSDRDKKTSAKTKAALSSETKTPTGKPTGGQTLRPRIGKLLYTKINTGGRVRRM